MNQIEILRQAKFQVIPAKGLTMEESIRLSVLPRLDASSTRLNAAEAVGAAKKVIETQLGRTNLTAKDMRNAIVGLIKL